MEVVTCSFSLEKELQNMRRDFHQYPESAWIEYRTSAKIADYLKEYGYEVYVGQDVCESTSRMGVPPEEFLIKHEQRALSQGANPKWINAMKGGHTGVVGVLKTNVPGPTIALRFDIDSLDIEENQDETHVPAAQGYRSKHDGMMHACGHDGHISIGLGVAKLLMENKHSLKGEIRLLFQPAEEGCRGGKSIVDKGWLDGVDYFYSGHIAFQSFELGEIVTAVGGFLATTKLDVTFSGQAAHAGNNPEKGKNALLAAASTSIHLHGIPRHSKGKSRINVGYLQAGSARNIIPEKASLAIEIRGENSEINDYMKNEAVRIIENMANVYDVKCEWKVVGQSPIAKSDREFMNSRVQVLENVDGVTKLVEYKNLNASEDVVYMINKVQSQGGKASYLLFGSPIPAGHHESTFDFDERVLPIAARTLAQLVLYS